MPISRDIWLSTTETPADHGCEIRCVGFSRKTGAQPYAFDNRHRDQLSILQWTTAGAGKFEAEVEHDMTAGKAFLVNLPSPTRYWLPAGKTWDFYYVTFTGAMARWHVDRLIVQHGNVFTGPVPELLRLTFDEAAGGRPPGKFTLSARLYQILMALYHDDRLADSPVERAWQYIEQEYADPTLAVEQIATRAGLSQYHFSRLFRAKTGTSPWAYLLQVRMCHARDLLISTQMPIKQISQATGFSDYSYFCRMYRQATGHTPACERLNH